jgi:MFS family permease
MPRNYPDKNKRQAKKDIDKNQINFKFSPWKLLFILSSISIMVMYVETMLLPAIPDIISEFNITYSMSSWIFASFIISALISTTIVSKLSDIYGRKKILLIVLTIYIFGVVGGGLSDNFVMLMTSRIVQGIGMSVFPIVFAIIQTQFPKDKIAIGQGTLASMFSFGGVLGLIVGGNITHNFGWHMTFFSILPIIIGVTLIIKYFVVIKSNISIVNRENSPLNHSSLNTKSIDIKKRMFSFASNNELSNFDIKGTVILAVMITSLIFALTLIQSESSKDKLLDIFIPTLLFTVSILSFFIFIIVEKRSSFPLINLNLITLKPILFTNILVLLWGIATFTIFQTIPVLVRTPIPMGIGGNVLDVVYLTMPFSIMSLIFGPTSGFIISKIGSYKVILAGSIITTIGFLIILLYHSNAIQIAISLAVIGSGLSLLNVGQININTTSTPIKFIGISFGVNTLFRFIGSAIGPAIAGMFMQASQIILYANHSNKAISYPSADSFVNIFFCMFILAIITIFLSIMIKKDRLIKFNLNR